MIWMKWFNVVERPEKLRTFNFFIGGRGIGKSYSMINHCASDRGSGRRFLYLCNTREQIENCATEAGNPFKKWNHNNNRDLRLASSANFANIVDASRDNEVLGYSASASTFNNLRGIDGSDIDIIFWDEFIEPKDKRLAYQQFDAFVNLYETVNRNRELENEQPVQVFFLSNARTAQNEVLAGFNLTDRIVTMIRSDQTTYSNNEVFLSLCKNEVSDAKRDTALYKTITGTKAYDENINNQFSHDSMAGIKAHVNLREYIPLFGYDDLYCYKHKSRVEYYICNSYSNNVPEFQSINGVTLWARVWWQTMSDAVSRGIVFYSSFTTKMQFEKLLRWK